MKERTAVFQKGFLNGLCPFPSIYTNEEYLEECLGMMPTSHGLDCTPVVQDATMVGLLPDELLEVSGSHKFPQYFPYVQPVNGGGVVEYGLECVRVPKMGNPQDTTEEYMYNENMKKPSLADFGLFLVGANGDNCWATTPTGIVQNLKMNPRFRCCCNYDGQLVIGDVHYTTKVQSSCSEDEDKKRNIEVSGYNIVMWSQIGCASFDMTFGNEAGWAVMPWRNKTGGSVHSLYQMGDELVVYSKAGIAKLSRHDTPTVTLGVKKFADFGPADSWLVASSPSRHLFIGPDNNLYIVEPQRALSDKGYAPKKLGYGHLLGDVKAILYDEINNIFWLPTKDKKCFVWSEAGLGESELSLGCLFSYNGESVGYGRFEEQERVVRTTSFSLNSRQIKTIMNIEVDHEREGEDSDSYRMQCRVDWKMGTGEIDFRKGKQIVLNKGGSCFPIQAGREFKIELRSEAHARLKLTKMWIHYKATDKHFSRGSIDAGATSSQANQ